MKTITNNIRNSIFDPAMLCWALLLCGCCSRAKPLDLSLPSSLPNTAIVAYSKSDNTWYISNKKIAETRTSPCSTFKILNSAIGLETGVLTGEDHPINHDPNRAPSDPGWPQSWQSDHTLKSAIVNSVVWYFREVAREIGSKRMRHFLNAVNYGNRDMSSGVDKFWLHASLKVSPIEQVEFLNRFFSGQLPFSKRTVDIVRHILPMEQGHDYVWRGKTGTCIEDDGTVNGWLVGIIEKEGRTYYFSIYVPTAQSLAEVSNQRLSAVRSLAESLHATPLRSDIAKHTVCPTIDKRCFKKVVALSRFNESTSVVWYPALPKLDEPILLLYNIRSHFSRFGPTDSIHVTFRPLQPFAPDATPGRKVLPGFERNLSFGRDGIAYVTIPARLVDRPGYIVFKGGSTLDNNYGSPWKLTAVQHQPVFKRYSTARFNYYYLADDLRTDRQIKTVANNFLRQLSKLERITGLHFKTRFDYFYYPSREALFIYQANQGNNFEEYRMRVYSCESRIDLHETTHLLFTQLGRHVGILDEGVAVYFGQEELGTGWRDRSCDSWVGELKRAGKLPAIRDILTPEEFYDDTWTRVGGAHYPVACSFSRFLIRRHGLPQFKKLFSKLNDQNQGSVNSVASLYMEVYKTSIEQLEQQWRSDLPSTL